MKQRRRKAYASGAPRAWPPPPVSGLPLPLSPMSAGDALGLPLPPLPIVSPRRQWLGAGQAVHKGPSQNCTCSSPPLPQALLWVASQTPQGGPGLVLGWALGAEQSRGWEEAVRAVYWGRPWGPCGQTTLPRTCRESKEAPSAQDGLLVQDLEPLDQPHCSPTPTRGILPCFPQRP